MRLNTNKVILEYDDSGAQCPNIRNLLAILEQEISVFLKFVDADGFRLVDSILYTFYCCFMAT